MKVSKKFSTKAIVLTCVLALALCCAVGGTIAWLVDKTATVENTFTYGNIDIDLTETGAADSDQDGVLENEFKMIPGRVIAKDPTVTVEAGSEACWLFVKLEKSANFDDFMTYTMFDGWTALNGHDGVYYREVADLTNATDDVTFAVLAQNQVVVKDTVTKAQIDAIGTNYPTLSVTAYAVQKEGIVNVADAWAAAQK